MKLVPCEDWFIAGCPDPNVLAFTGGTGVVTIGDRLFVLVTVHKADGKYVRHTWFEQVPDEE